MNTIEQNLFTIAREEKGSHWNSLIESINDHCIRLAVNENETYSWHRHPNSDEVFLVLEGKLVLEFENDEKKELMSGDFFRVPANTTHRTIAVERTVNLCFEKRNIETVFLEASFFKSAGHAATKSHMEKPKT